jgi:hypothetical protein
MPNQALHLTGAAEDSPGHTEYADQSGVTMSDSQPSASAEQRAPRTPLDLLHWVGMVPASLLGGWFGRSVGGLFLFLRNLGYPEYLFPLMFLLPSGLVFTVAGTLVAPRYRIAVAIGLTALCLIQSLVIHILMPSSPGLVNYMHSIGESLGATLGAILITLLVRKSRNGLPTQHTR